MSPTPSRMVAVIASLALAACSSIGTINGQRLDVGATPNDAGPAPHYWHPCEDFEFLCIVAVAAAVGFAIAFSQHSKTPPGSAPVVNTPTPTPTPTPGP